MKSTFIATRHRRRRQSRLKFRRVTAEYTVHGRDGIPADIDAVREDEYKGTAQGLFHIEVEQIIEEADYDPKASDTDDDEDDEMDDHDDDEPF